MGWSRADAMKKLNCDTNVLNIINATSRIYITLKCVGCFETFKENATSRIVYFILFLNIDAISRFNVK